jgi:hypothetical protein
MRIKKIVVGVAASLAALATFQVIGQSSKVNERVSNRVQGVPVMFGDSRVLSGLTGDGLTHGTGQFGAETVSACYYDYRTHVIANFPANISSGWIKTNERSNSYCIPPGGLPQPNWEEMTYFLNLPIGTVLRVCWNGNTWPATWTPISYAKDSSLCGYWPSGVPASGYPNIMYIRRDS